MFVIYVDWYFEWKCALLESPICDIEDGRSSLVPADLTSTISWDKIIIYVYVIHKGMYPFWQIFKIDIHWLAITKQKKYNGRYLSLLQSIETQRHPRQGLRHFLVFAAVLLLTTYVVFIIHHKFRIHRGNQTGNTGTNNFYSFSLLLFRVATEHTWGSRAYDSKVIGTLCFPSRLLWIGGRITGRDSLSCSVTSRC